MIVYVTIEGVRYRTTLRRVSESSTESLMVKLLTGTLLNKQLRVLVYDKVIQVKCRDSSVVGNSFLKKHESFSTEKSDQIEKHLQLAVDSFFKEAERCVAQHDKIISESTDVRNNLQGILDLATPKIIPGESSGWGDFFGREALAWAAQSRGVKPTLPRSECKDCLGDGLLGGMASCRSCPFCIDPESE